MAVAQAFRSAQSAATPNLAQLRPTCQCLSAATPTLHSCVQLANAFQLPPVLSIDNRHVLYINIRCRIGPVESRRRGLGLQSQLTVEIG